MKWGKFVLWTEIAALTLVAVSIILQVMWFFSRDTVLLHLTIIAYAIACALFSRQIHALSKTAQERK